eukprot:UN10107
MSWLYTYIYSLTLHRLLASSFKNICYIPIIC